MEPALVVAVLWMLFGGTHIGLATRRVRAALVARLGEGGFTALFSAVAPRARPGSRWRTWRCSAGHSWRSP